MLLFSIFPSRPCPTPGPTAPLCSNSKYNIAACLHAGIPGLAEAAAVAAAAAAAAATPDAQQHSHSQAEAEAARLTDNLLPDWTAAASGPFPGAGLIPGQSLPQGSAPGDDA